jgi:alpha-mannosidase
MKQADNLARRFEQLKTRVGGNREKKRFEFTFGTPAEQQMGVTPPSRAITRILSEMHFALEMSRQQGQKFDISIGDALSVLEDCMEKEGTLTNSACMAAEEKLLPLRDAAKEYALIYVSHAHIDMNWMWGMQETVAAALSTFRSVLHMMEEYPEFTFMQSQASVYKIVEAFARQLMPEIKACIAEGRWEVTANAWVETDKNMPSAESLLHHVEVTRRYLEKVWGIDTDKVQVDFSPDTFATAASFPKSAGSRASNTITTAGAPGRTKRCSGTGGRPGRKSLPIKSLTGTTAACARTTASACPSLRQSARA